MATEDAAAVIDLYSVPNDAPVALLDCKYVGGSAGNQLARNPVLTVPGLHLLD